MIRLLTDENNPLRVDQWCVSPAVYLDHWAIRRFSEDDGLRSRFVSAVRSKNGTVVLSWLNLVEFSRVSDADQVRAAGEMIQSILPNLFFMEINPFTVIENENKLLDGHVPFPPQADKPLLRAFFLLEQCGPCPYDAMQLFRIAQESDQSGQFDSLADTIVERITSFRDNLERDTSLQRQLRKAPRTSPIQAGTRYVFRELVRQIALDKQVPVRRNDAIDFMHTVVPVSYCDIVLLDGHWRSRVEQLRRRLDQANATFPLAKVYSQRAGGLDQFLRFFES